MANKTEYGGEFISLYDHLGHAAGGKLGQKKLKVKIFFSYYKLLRLYISISSIM